MFISSIVGGLQTIAVGAVTYFTPENMTAINTSIVAVGALIIEVLANFVKDETVTPTETTKA